MYRGYYNSGLTRKWLGCLTIQTVKDVGLFPTAYAQSNEVQKIAICNERGNDCADIGFDGLEVDLD